MSESIPPDSEPTTAPLSGGDEGLGEPRGRPWLAVALSWIVPGLGHAYLGRWRRGLVFALLIAFLIWVGVLLRGPIWSYTVPLPGAGSLPLSTAVFNLPLLLIDLLGHEGLVTARGYEYGMTYLLTASIFSLLLMLDAWDISRGHQP